MIKITIDNITVEVEEGSTILEAARKIGGEIVPPTMCYYSKLAGTGGKCRTCLVKVTRTSASNARPMPKLVASCSTNAEDGMIVQNITSPEVIEARKVIIEFLLANHPLDCPVCDQAGECKLQDISFNYGIEKTRYEEERRTFDLIDVGDKIKLHMNRCILCYRCVYIAEQLTGKRTHGIISRGDKAEISTFIKNSICGDFSGNMIDVCPVGALTDKTFRFKSRVWFLKPVNAHRKCNKCKGEVVLWLFGNEIYRITTRTDKYGEVKDWICDECRFDKKNLNDWISDGNANISNKSVIAQNLYYKSMKK